MNWGFWICVCVVPCFLILGIMFAALKERSAKFVSGFNSLSEEEQKMYDKAQIAKDMRNSCFLWSAVMTAGAVLSCFLTPYMSVAAYVVWGVLFFKDVHLDAHKAFEKYLLK